MSRYDWPATPAAREHDDDPAGRADFNGQRRIGLGSGSAREAALEQLHAPLPRGTPRPRAPASSDNDLWQPLGPAVMLGGQAEGSPRVSGRISAVVVHPAGARAYAASANGGVWATDDGGAHWQSVGGLASTPLLGILRPAHRNSCGALHVVWRGVAPGNELVFLGTGEPHVDADGRSSDGELGLGVFVADKPLASAQPDPWKREAINLVNDAVYGFAGTPDGSRIWAATRTGLYERPPEPVAADAPWPAVTVAPFNTKVRCTAVVYTPASAADDAANPKPGNTPGRLWAWVQDGAKFGLWVREDGAAAFTRVATEATSPAALPFVNGRGVLAAPPGTPGHVWLMINKGNPRPPGLFRVGNPIRSAGAPKAMAVSGLLNILRDQGWYNIALAVDPANPNRLAMAGSFLGDRDTPADRPLWTTPDGAERWYDASIVIDTVVAGPAATPLKFGNAPGVGQFIGLGVHPDVHALAFSHGGATLWCGNDGGMFRSDRLASQAGFYPINTGLAISETNYLAASTAFEGEMVCGLQDNGIAERLSSATWRVAVVGDGGGIVLDPLQPWRWLGQSTAGTWYDEAGQEAGPLKRGARWAVGERDAAAFYSQAAVIRHSRGVAPNPVTPTAQILLGTHRVWYSDNGDANWITLPTATDPLPAVIPAPAPPLGSPAGTPAVPPVLNTAQDDLGEKIHACRWANPDCAFVLGAGNVYRLDRVPGSHNNPVASWSIARVLGVAADATDPAPIVPPKPEGKAKKRDPVIAPIDPAALLTRLRTATTWTEIEPNEIPAAGADPVRHALYLGTTGNGTDDRCDTLWWNDGLPPRGTWWPTGLRLRGAPGDAASPQGKPLPASVTAIAVDPALPDEVWIGTTVGVVKGVRSAVANPPADQPPWHWDFTLMVNGLPEAGIEDLAIFTDGTLRLLRASIGARGVWELRLDQQAVQPASYLRVHRGDLRHRPVARLLRPDGTQRSWHASPDIRPRLKPDDASLPRPGNPGWRRGAFGGQTERLRRLQAALRQKTGDPRIVGNGLWDGYFSELLRDHGAPTVSTPARAPQAGEPALPNHARVKVDNAFWDSVMVAANRNAEPWGAGPATEADLLEMTPAVEEGQADRAAHRLKRAAWWVDVVVHQRGRLPQPGSGVKLTLLAWADPAAQHRARFNEVAKWAPGPVPWAQVVNDMMNSADGASAALPAGWFYAGTTNATRRLTLNAQALDPLHPGVARFELSLPPAVKLAQDGVVLLVAIVHAKATPLALPADSLQDLVLKQPGVAVRAVRIA